MPNFGRDEALRYLLSTDLSSTFQTWTSHRNLRLKISQSLLILHTPPQNFSPVVPLPAPETLGISLDAVPPPHSLSPVMIQPCQLDSNFSCFLHLHGRCHSTSSCCLGHNLHSPQSGLALICSLLLSQSDLSKARCRFSDSVAPPAFCGSPRLWDRVKFL